MDAITEDMAAEARQVARQARARRIELLAELAAIRDVERQAQRLLYAIQKSGETSHA